MKCKSCNNSIKNTDKFCSHCGSLIVNEKLSLKGTWYEFIGPFFNWDNNFWKTFKHLFSNPKRVLNAYISGARKKYFKPFPFLIVYATLALFFNKFFPESDFDDSAKAFNDGYQSASDKINENIQRTQFFNDVDELIYNYFNIFIILFIPIFGYISFLVFRKRGNNFAEHLVFQSYILSILGYLSIIIQLILLNLLNINYSVYELCYYIIIIIYSNYVFTRLYNLNFKSILVSNLKFWGLLAIFILLLTAISIVYLG